VNACELNGRAKEVAGCYVDRQGLYLQSHHDEAIDPKDACCDDERNEAVHVDRPVDSRDVVILRSTEDTEIVQYKTTHTLVRDTGTP
jgi:hypothetical protein